MSVPLVTVVMTAYNAESFIEEALESVKNQTFRDFEFMLFDDGSTDSTVEVIEKYMNRNHIGCRTRSWGACKDNYGVASGRQASISLSNSKYIAIADADDVSVPDRLEKQVAFLEANDDIFCCGAGITHFNDKGRETDSHLQPQFHDDIIKKLVRGVNPIYDPTAIFRMDDYHAMMGYNDGEDRLYVPDLDLWCRAVLRGLRFHNLQEYLVKYRVHKTSNCALHLAEILRQHKLVHGEFMEKYREMNKGK